MTDQKVFTREELLSDRKECIEDIELCARASLAGITQYSGHSVVERAYKNSVLIKVIDEMLEKLPATPPTDCPHCGRPLARDNERGICYTCWRAQEEAKRNGETDRERACLAPK